MPALCHDERHGLADVMNFSARESRGPRTAQNRFDAFEPASGMNFETFGKPRNAAVDFRRGPNSDNALKPKSSRSIDPADPRMSVSTPHECRMQHIRQTDVGHVQALAGEKAARLLGPDATPDVSGRFFFPGRHFRFLIQLE
jgi:hypothetical protein